MTFVCVSDVRGNRVRKSQKRRSTILHPAVFGVFVKHSGFGILINYGYRKEQ